MGEEVLLQEDAARTANWKRWGPYLSERQWGTVREDYSEDGNCWDYFSHDQSRSRAYRWGEDGLLGVTDRQCRLCMCLGLWNGNDPILKERLYGLTGTEGNHGEDCKECYYYLDSSPSHSYMKALYKYPQAAYPYSQLLDGNRGRGKDQMEFELEDTGVFEDGRYWDVFAEYAKHTPNDVLCQFTICNRGPEVATVHVLPQLWFRNTWIWGCKHEGCTAKPKLKQLGPNKIQCDHESLGRMFWEVTSSSTGVDGELLFTENETNSLKLFNSESYTPYVKDAFHRYVVDGEKDAVSPKGRGTKACAYYVLTVLPGDQVVLQSRLYQADCIPKAVFGRDGFDAVFALRKKQTDEYYAKVIVNDCPDQRAVARQAYAGLLWSKQFYHMVVKDWLEGDADQPKPPAQRRKGRNHDWGHLFNKDIVSMPDKWEYPWYAAWDLAFHMIPMAEVDQDFAKHQLILFLREWYMHPNGQMPAYEFAFEDVNPPVHAWAVLSVWRKTGPRGNRDNVFLARCFQKLILNFTWWVNRKDIDGANIFAGGFLGLDNIGVFDRSKPLPDGAQLQQADGTAWMAFFCSSMLDIALELAESDPVYEDMASKFFEHFIAIMDAMNQLGGDTDGLWDDEDGFYYDCFKQNGLSVNLRIRSLVGLVPLFSCLALEKSRITKLKGFFARTKWFTDNRKDLTKQMSFMLKEEGSKDDMMLLAIPKKEQLVRVLGYMLDEEEFLSPFGIRSVSKFHKDHPYVVNMGGEEMGVSYVPGESNTYMFGGNSNWRGPIWLCMNFLIVEALKRYHYFYEDSLKVECPTRSGKFMNLKDVSFELARRMANLFLADKDGHRPCHGGADRYATDPFWKDLILYYEFFHGDSGRGCGASHQTGWTAVVACALKQLAEREECDQKPKKK